MAGWADALWDQGARFGTVGLKKGELVFEITTHRAEAYAPDSRKPEVSFADEVEADLARRDFTVNAMALRVTGEPGEAPELIDPFGGVADLAAGVLRTPLGPDVSFTDDPLRMLRAARFIAGYGLAPEPSLIEAVDPAGRAPRDRVRRAGPRRAVEAPGGQPIRARACGSSSTPASPTSSFPSCRPCRSSRIRSTGTRTCSPTPSPSWRRPGPTSGCGWRRSSTTWASRGPGRSARRACPSTTTRWSGPGWRGIACGRCGSPTSTSRRSASWSTCTCASTATATMPGPMPLCGATSATPARSSTT